MKFSVSYSQLSLLSVFFTAVRASKNQRKSFSRSLSDSKFDSMENKSNVQLITIKNQTLFVTGSNNNSLSIRALACTLHKLWQEFFSIIFKETSKFQTFD
jgi:hypothetical protein